ncbi:DNA-directed RNA polymerase III subunit RPC3 [Pseudomyrmex gracilis]|uniref:DNA-directed RNA polymerase III subunit RPC3 n=1 Tax=Pseudomyrmex gracilis TaxID=219809 RepID=UPI000995051A|nr:DNA-directed RNA polymerase III subunit RPC3 [Pseudomyrmex gracilis]
MKDLYGKLCSSLLEEYFGSIVQSVGNNLLCGKKTLRLIWFGTGLPLAKVKEGLCVLVKHGFVTYHQDEDNNIEYTIEQNKIIMLLRYPRFIFFVKTCCGDEAEVMIEEVLKHGYITASDVIIKTYKRIEQTPSKSAEVPSISQLKDIFELLLKNRFLMRSLSFDTKLQENDKPNYVLPNIDVRAIASKLQNQAADLPDKDVHWKVNFDRLIEDLRDQIIISAVNQRFDKNAAELMRRMIILMELRTLSWADTSNPIPFTEIREEIRKDPNYPELEQYLDQYLRLIEEDNSQFIKRVGDSGGGQYSIDMKNIFKELTWATIENIVTDKYGSKAARIFRLVRKEYDLGIDQIQRLAMLPAKEAKYLCYILAQENYMQIHERKRGGTSTGLTKGLFRFSIDLSKVVQMKIEHCCHALYNIIKRRDHETSSNRRMIEKQLRVQILSDNLKEHGATEQQLADIAEMMTPSESEQLEKAQNAIKKLAATELQIDETLFLLTLYFRYH